MAIDRRKFLEFMGRSAAAAAITSVLPLGCGPASQNGQQAAEGAAKTAADPFSFKPLEPLSKDQLVLAEGFDYQMLLSWGDPLNDTDRFGFNNDYTVFLQDRDNPDEGLLWVNHEYIHPLFIHGTTDPEKKTRAQVEQEMENVGGSMVAMKRQNGQWKPQSGHPKNRRITGKTPIPFNWEEPIAGSKEAMGTLANCAGGTTPWGTILTCEENYQDYYGDRIPTEAGSFRHTVGGYGWGQHFDKPPEHYGWVVEVDPQTGQAQKHVALGRFAHECATVRELSDGRVVVYTGDDKNDEFIYKFVGNKPGSLREGTLYVANTEKGQWLALDLEQHPELKKDFNNQTQVLVYARDAARKLGATPQARPEDFAIDPSTDHVFVALTNNKPQDNYHGSILKIVEDNDDPTSLTFRSETFLMGGEAGGLSCPDNLAFDPKGNLWVTTDISGSQVGEGPYKPFGNNGVFVVPMSGEKAGQALQVASGPMDCEMTGPSFSPDGQTLFLSVQHPGEGTQDLSQPTSHWPEGGNATPKPSVVAISGQSLRRIMEGA